MTSRRWTEAQQSSGRPGVDLAEGYVNSNKTAVLLSNTMNSASTLGLAVHLQRRQIMQDRCGPSRFPRVGGIVD